MYEFAWYTSYIACMLGPVMPGMQVPWKNMQYYTYTYGRYFFEHMRACSMASHRPEGKMKKSIEMATAMKYFK